MNDLMINGAKIERRGMHRILLLLTLVGFECACSRHYVPMKVNTVSQFEELEDSSAKSEARQEVKQNEPWWQTLGDTQLNELVEGLFTKNLQLKQATERISQFRALAIQAGSQRWPTVNLDLGWSRTKQLNPFARLSSGSSMGMAPSSGLPSSFTQDNFRASLAVSYELDVWGRVGSITEAAELDAMASEADLKALAITLSATTVDLYLQLIEAQIRYSTLQEQLNDDEDQLRVVLTRYQQGISPHIEVLQLTQQRDRTRSQIPPMKALLANLKRRLAALRGEQRLQKVILPSNLPKLPPLPNIGIPATVLEERPDIQAATTRLKAADARVSAAVSARLPSLRFGTNVGYQSFELNELFDDAIWNLTSNILTPIFQGGRLKAEQKRTEAVLRERLHALHEIYLTAYHEVETALANEKSAYEQWQRVQEQYRSAQSLFESAEHRYLQGVGDFLTMLTARQGLFTVRLALLSAQRATLSARVQLHRALGGHWLNNMSLNSSNPKKK